MLIEHRTIYFLLLFIHITRFSVGQLIYIIEIHIIHSSLFVHNRFNNFVHKMNCRILNFKLE